MRAILFLLVVASVAAADPIHAKLGTQKVTLTPCTVEGPALYLGNVMSGVVAAPDGGLLVLDGDGGVHRYLVAKGAACRLTPDRQFGVDGVIATEIAAKDDDWASVAMDRAGAIFVSGSVGTVRIVAGKVGPMCMAGEVAASPRSDHVWAWTSSDHVYRIDRECDEGNRVDLSEGRQRHIRSISALDDRILVNADGQLEILDAHGALLQTLAEVKPSSSTFDVCGKGVCGATDDAFYAWGADGKLLGSFATQPLSQSALDWVPHGFATAGATGWLLGDEDTDTAPAHAAIILRVDGLPR